MALDTERADNGLAKALAQHFEGDANALAFAAMLYGGVALDGAELDLPKLDLAGLAADSRETMAFIAEKPANRHKIRVRPSASRLHGRNRNPQRRHAVSGRQRHGRDPGARHLPVHLVVHPILRTLRNAAGQIKAILGPADQNWADGHQESLIVIHLDPLAAEAAGDLGRALAEILGEVRAAVTDWRRC